MTDSIRAALEQAIPPDWRELCRELLDLADRLYKQSVTQPHNQVLRLSNGLHPIPIGNDILVQDVGASFTLDRARTALAIHSPAPAVPDTDDVPALAAEPATPSAPPPFELVEEWVSEIWHEGTPVRVAASDLHVAQRAAEWGARRGAPAPMPGLTKPPERLTAVAQPPPPYFYPLPGWVASRTLP